MQFRLFTAVSIAVAVLAGGVARAQDGGVTIGDMRSAYEQNILSLFPYRVDVHLSKIQTQVESSSVAKDLKAIKESLSASNASEDHRKILGMLRDKLQRRMDRLSAKHTQYLYRLYLDRRRFQMQIPTEFANGVSMDTIIADYTFRDMMPTTGTLRGEFADFHIKSCSSSSAVYMTWSPDGTGLGRGWISDSPFTFCQSQYLLPPLGAIGTSWPDTCVFSVFDALVIHPVAEYTLVGAETVDGAELLKVEHTSNRPFVPNVALPDGTHEKQDRTLIWVDPNQGFLPVRVEVGTRSLFNGQVVNSGHNAPDRVATVQSITQINGSYLPTLMHFDDYKTFSETPISGVPTPAEFRQGSTFDFPRVMYMREVLHLDNIVPMTENDLLPFVFEFPDKTRYFDKRINRSMIVGMTAAELDELTLANELEDSKLQPKAAGLSRRSSPWMYFVGLNVVVLCALAYLFLRRR